MVENGTQFSFGDRDSDPSCMDFCLGCMRLTVAKSKLSGDSTIYVAMVKTNVLATLQTLLSLLLPLAAAMVNPTVFFDISADGEPLGRVCFELFAD
ncbi:hypothetical protein STEG23_009007 [Scotinomys teguina]